jgi:hypothetical protein
MNAKNKVTWNALSAELSHAQDDVAAAMVRLTRLPRPLPHTEEAEQTFSTWGARLARVDEAQRRLSAFLRCAR